MNRIGVLCNRPERSTQMSNGPLTMISVTVSSSSSRSSGPWPRMSSASSSTSRSRSSREIPASAAEATAKLLVDPEFQRSLVKLGVEELPAEVLDQGQVDPVLDLRERLSHRLGPLRAQPGRAARGAPDAWTGARGAPSALPGLRAGTGSCGTPAARPGAPAVSCPSRYRPASERNARAASEAVSSTIGVPWLTERAMSRWLGISTSTSRPRMARTSSRSMPDVGVGPVEDDLDPAAVVVHPLERLQAEAGVLERQRVAHRDHHDVGGAVDRPDDLGTEARAACRSPRTRSSRPAVARPRPGRAP